MLEAFINARDRFLKSGGLVMPSRGDMSLLAELGSAAFPVRWPDLRSGWTGTFEAIFDEFSAAPTKAEKRARRKRKSL